MAKKTETGVRSPIKRTRKVRELVKLALWVMAGGRCQLRGCNKYLLKHHLTGDIGNFADVAHVVAFNEDGPRGKSEERPDDINALENLMLLCGACHRLVDKTRPADFPVPLLREYKQLHEERILRQTEATEDFATTILQLKSRIRGDMVDIPATNVRAAVAPRYAHDPKGCIIDLTADESGGQSFFDSARETITRKVARLYEPGMELETTRHISLFALAPMPLLIHLGTQLSNKVAVDVYQRHRDTDDWAWKRDGKPVEHEFRLVREGTNLKNVALLLSLSGTLTLSKLPAEIDDSFYIYEITLKGVTPNPRYLRLAAEVEDFRRVYQESLRTIENTHHDLENLHLFPAVPAPIAVHCGRDLMPKTDPVIKIYDNDSDRGGFYYVFSVNERTVSEGSSL